MNPDNYATYEASRRLYDAGIVLETDVVWYLPSTGVWELIVKPLFKPMTWIPAPCFTEVWRELPYGVGLTKLTTNYVQDVAGNYEFESDNPTDALIEILICLKEDGK